MIALASLTASAAQVALTSSDGVHLAGEDYGAGRRAILLVHDAARSRADFSTLAPRLASAGYHVLAIDLRGHGASAASTATDADWSPLVGDVEAGVGWLRDHGATEVHLLGVGAGANLALSAAAATPSVTDLILLSPALNAHGVKVSTAIGPFGARPLLVVASTDDALALRTATWLQSSATGPAALQTYPGSAAGPRLLMSAPDLENRIVGWLASAGAAAAAPDAIPSKAGELKTGVTAIETTGTRLEDRHR
jgi:pimeloyl-ACP methyl ester carboxylesterase